jgi:hypothetical protein
MRARALLPIALLALAGGVSTGDRDRAVAKLDFEFSGCARVRPGRVCELGADRELTLWVSGSKPLELEMAGARTKRVEGGWQTKIRVPSRTQSLRLRAGALRAELHLVESSEPEPLRKLARLWKAGRWDEVRASIETARLQGPERGRLRAFRARLALRAGDNALAAAELEASSKSARESGLLLEASNDLFAAAYTRAVRLAEYDRARALLASAESQLTHVPETRARLPYYWGVLARVTGDVQGSLVQFRKASMLARRLDLLSDELLARQELATTLNQLRRHSEALEEQRAVVSRAVDGPSCLYSLRWENLAWMLLTQSDPALQNQAAEALAQAEGSYERCPDPLSRRNQRLNRVKLALLRGDAETAEAVLKALEGDATGRSTRLAAWQALYQGELFLLRSEAQKAVGAFEQAAALAAGIQVEDCMYLARLGRARALSEQGDAAALTAYLEAEEAADALVNAAPFGQGQQLTALEVQQSSRELLSLLLRRGELRSAYTLALRASERMWASNFRTNRIAAASGPLRARWERAVSEYQRLRAELERAARDDWKLSSEGLRAIRLSRALQTQQLESALANAHALFSPDEAVTATAAPDEAHLLLAAGKEGFWAFAARGDTLEAVLAAPASTPSAGRARAIALALEQFQQKALFDAPLLSVSLPPELLTLDLHALPVAGRALIEHVPVAYTFGPGASRERGPAEARPVTALVLGDPNLDLPWAGSEARQVAGRFSSSIALIGADVTFEAASRHLPGARLLHFAGHASSGGLDGVDGALRLNAGQRWSLGDVFSMPRVPEFVVLSACTSSVSPERGGGLSIGQAFVAAGSRAVLGASRAISDSLARRFVHSLYDALFASAPGAAAPPGDVRAWAAAARTASLNLKRSDPGADWASMRLLLP